MAGWVEGCRSNRRSAAFAHPPQLGAAAARGRWGDVLAPSGRGKGSPGGAVEKSLPAGRRGFDPWVGKIPRSRKWQPTPAFLPGKSHGQRSLTGYTVCGLQS